jgi:hypothetical protein
LLEIDIVKVVTANTNSITTMKNKTPGYQSAAATTAITPKQWE